MVGGADVARLHAKPEFRAAVAAARSEVVAARAQGLEPTRDCAAEAEALNAAIMAQESPVPD